MGGGTGGMLEGVTDFASRQNVEGMPILVDGQVSITGPQLIGVSDAGVGFVAIEAVERRIRLLKQLQMVPLSGVDAAITGFDTHVAFIPQTYRSVPQQDHIRSEGSSRCRFAERMLTVVPTFRLQHRSDLAYLERAIAAHRHGEPAPKLLG
jgi:hypothetical protein